MEEYDRLGRKAEPIVSTSGTCRITKTGEEGKAPANRISGISNYV